MTQRITIQYQIDTSRPQHEHERMRTPVRNRVRQTTVPPRLLRHLIAGEKLPTAILRYRLHHSSQPAPRARVPRRHQTHLPHGTRQTHRSRRTCQRPGGLIGVVLQRGPERICERLGLLLRCLAECKGQARVRKGGAEDARGGRRPARARTSRCARRDARSS